MGCHPCCFVCLFTHSKINIAQLPVKKPEPIERKSDENDSEEEEEEKEEKNVKNKDIGFTV